MLNVPHDESLSNNSWKIWLLPGGKQTVITRCTNGHIGTLVHHVSGDGTVSPSVVCQRPGCDFHEFIKLEDWQEYGLGEVDL